MQNAYLTSLNDNVQAGKVHRMYKLTTADMAMLPYVQKHYNGNVLKLYNLSDVLKLARMKHLGPKQSNLTTAKYNQILQILGLHTGGSDVSKHKRLAFLFLSHLRNYCTAARAHAACASLSPPHRSACRTATTAQVSCTSECKDGSGLTASAQNPRASSAS